MARKHSVLWIEDGARSDLPYLAAPVYMSGCFDLVVAEDISEAVSYMLSREFQVIIVDIRMPPGFDKRWIDAFQKGGSDKVAARLGLKLLQSMLAPDQAEVHLENRPEWIAADRVGVLTVEGPELLPELQELGIQAYRQKTAGMSYQILLELTEEVLSGSELAAR